MSVDIRIHGDELIKFKSECSRKMQEVFRDLQYVIDNVQLVRDCYKKYANSCDSYTFAFSKMLSNLDRNAIVALTLARELSENGQGIDGEK